MTKQQTITSFIDDLCLSLPDVERPQGRHMTTFKVNAKTFAYVAINHHGDGRIALWLNTPVELRDALIENDPSMYFVPPYVGKRGFIGVDLKLNSDWDQVTGLVIESFLHTAKGTSEFDLGTRLAKVARPNTELAPAAFDPLQAHAVQTILTHIRKFAASLPETCEKAQFGAPAFKAGKKTFATVSARDGKALVEMWVGVENQAAFIADMRFSIPRYTGHNGWLLMVVASSEEFPQMEQLLLNSYRHFALKRMLKALDGE